MTQAELASKKSQEGSQARDQLILNELPNVHYIARRVYERLPRHVPFEDLVHAGVIGLIEAVRSYDAQKSVPLRAYAKFRIRGAIVDSLRALDWGSRGLRRKGRRIEDAMATLSAKLGRQPETEEIAAEIGISIEEFHETALRVDGLTLIGQVAAPVSDQSETKDLIESAPSHDANPYDLCLFTEIKDKLAKAIVTLSPREQMVITLHYNGELTMKEIAAVLNLCESRVMQIRALALLKIREALQETANGSSEET